MIMIAIFFKTYVLHLVLNIDFEPKNVKNLDRLRENQLKKLENLRERVKQLRFVPIDPAGFYIPLTFKSFDGGMFNLHFDPFEFDIVKVADSNGNMKMNFAAPGGDFRDSAELEPILSDLDADPVIKNFLSIVGMRSLKDTTEILTNRGTLMEIAEFACMFNAVMQAPADGQMLILRDGLLRTKKIKSELIVKLRNILSLKKDHVKIVGVAKTSRIVFLLQAALLCEGIFPKDQIGYVKIPLELENMAYRWSGRGLLASEKPAMLNYAFGNLYVAKLSRQRDLFVTVEIPGEINGSQIYSSTDVTEIMGYLAKDSAYSYPVIGYPQTIMRAHEFASSFGIPASILRDKIMEDLVKNTDPMLASYVRDSRILGEVVEKGSLGGRA